MQLKTKTILVNTGPASEVSETGNNTSYRQIMKATSIFGGVQVFNIVVSVIRSKFVAVLLGPAGMGIADLLNSTTNLIASMTNLGLSTSAVKNIAAANASGNSSRVSVVSSVLRRLVWITGVLGALVTLVLSPWLSKLTFGNKDYTIAFIWISIVLLIKQISSGQLVVLQGMRRIQYLAKASVAGNIFALFISIPIYYAWGVRGIVPAIILSAFISFLFTWYYAAKVKIQPVKVTKAELLSEGGDMVRMGFILSINSLIALLTSYLVRIFISHTGGLAQVGLYQAGFAFINTYVGMVFTAMATDYFPRLSGIAHDNTKARNMINQQAEVAFLILAPILTIFLIYINYVVILFYSAKFISVDRMIHWAALGIFLKAASWPIAYIMIAKGHTKLYFYNELTANIYTLGLNILGYQYRGLEGLGISFLIGYLIYFLQVFILARRKYEFAFEKEFNKIFVIQVSLGILCFLISRILNPPYLYFAGSLVILFSFYYSLKELNKRLKLMPLILQIFKKNSQFK
jgi:O-antigen/teichoic acid export membrane protein